MKLLQDKKMLPGCIYLLLFITEDIASVIFTGLRMAERVKPATLGGGLNAYLSDWAPSKVVGTRKKKNDDARF